MIVIQGYNELKPTLCVLQSGFEDLACMCVKLQSFSAFNLVKGGFSYTISVPT